MIETGHREAFGSFFASPDAVPPTEANGSQAKLVATAEIAGAIVKKPAGDVGRITLAEKPKITVQLLPDPAAGLGPPGVSPGSAGEIVVAPGNTISALLKIDRRGFNERVNLEIKNLPHGVIVADLGLNNVLIPAGETERQIFLNCAKWVPATSRMIHAVVLAEGNQASLPVTLHVRGAK